MAQDDDILSSPEVGSMIGKSSRSVQRLAHAGVLKPVTRLPGPNGPFLFRRDEVERYIASLTEEKQPA